MSPTEGTGPEERARREPRLAAALPSFDEIRDASAEETAFAHRSVGLVDAVDHLLDRGACVVGDATISLGGVDLIYLGISLVVSSVETLRQKGVGGPDLTPGRPLGPPSRAREGGEETEDHPQFVPSSQPQQDEHDFSPKLPLPAHGKGGPKGAPGLGPAPGFEVIDAPPALGQPTKPTGPPGLVAGSPEAQEAQNGLARLVLTLVELLRQLLERQAVRRMEGESLSEEEIERMGTALLDLEAKLTELRDLFGLTEADLNVDLGPLGRLL